MMQIGMNVQLLASLLKAIEIMLIPARDIPVRNLIMANMTNDVETALRIAKVSEDR